MRVLIACEFSGIVREAFKARGHDAWSCDLLDTEIPGQHIKDDVLKHLNENWDLMIAHPPCTYLTVSGNRWFKDTERYFERLDSAEFFFNLMFANIHKIAVENPIGVMSGFYRKPDQIIQPWQFGHGETKAICLWLKNLPPLLPTEIAQERKQRVFYESPGPERWKNRSRFFTGIASAMAEQWT